MGNVVFHGYGTQNYSISISAKYARGKTLPTTIDSFMRESSVPKEDVELQTGILQEIKVKLTRVNGNYGVDYYFTGNGDRQGSLILGQDVVLPTSPSSEYDFFLVDRDTKKKINQQ